MKEPFSKILGISEKDKEEVKRLPVEVIDASPYQPRTIFNDDKLQELCQTIKTHGIIQPIVVRVKDDRFELIAGERRLRAAKILGMETIPAIIKNFNDAQTASVALIENLQREGLTAIEEATAYQQLIQLHNLTQESLAQRLGKGQSTIANKIRLLNLSPTIQEALLSRKITERHARALLPLNDQTVQEKILREVIEKELNVKQTENRVKFLLEAKAEPSTTKPKKLVVSKDVRIAMNTIRQSVEMVLKTGLAIETDEQDYSDHYEIVIRIPKKS